jgi:FSR family fosmidomycin resistance protein-like MFS transporter
MPRPSSTLIFSSLGHLYVHLFTAIYFVIVLTLEQVWQRPYHELVALWTLGSLLVGAAALPAGMLSDRFGPTKIMSAFFLGIGVCAIGAGLAGSPASLVAGLTGIGLFASIYHPVGIPWLVRNTSDNRGKALGFNGIFGSLGTAAAGLTAGVLIDVINWRAAFIVPGVASLFTGIAMVIAARRGTVTDGPSSHHTEDDPPEKNEIFRAFAVLAVTMFIAGLVYHATQTALPKTLAVRFGAEGSQSALNVGLLVAVVYGIAGVMQLGGGYLADRYPLKYVYIGAILLQIPTLFLVGELTGVALVTVAMIMVMAGAGALPAENMLLSRYAPKGRQGLAFGAKFVLAFGAAPLSVQLVARVTERTGSVFLVFTFLTGLAAISFLVAMSLPNHQSNTPAASA